MSSDIVSSSDFSCKAFQDNSIRLFNQTVSVDRNSLFMEIDLDMPLHFVFSVIHSLSLIFESLMLLSKSKDLVLFVYRRFFFSALRRRIHAFVYTTTKMQGNVYLAVTVALTNRFGPMRGFQICLYLESDIGYIKCHKIQYGGCVFNLQLTKKVKLNFG